MKPETGAMLYNGKKNILWGAGRKGRQALFDLAALGIYIEMFCDSDEGKQNIRIYNKKVISPQEILKEGSKYNIIIAVEKDQHVQQIIQKIIGYKIHDYIKCQEIEKPIYPITVNREDLYRMIQDSYVKKLIIYGTSQEAYTLNRILTMLDVEVPFFIDDIKEEYEWLGYTVKPAYDLLYEVQGDYKVIVMPEKINNSSILDGMGLKIGCDYNIFGNYKWQIPEKHILDPNLGYNFVYQDNMPGFVRIGEKGKRLVLLGGSTTDANRFPFKSWGELLYEKLKVNGYDVVIYNGGCAGYKSSQELIKLIRDVIPMRPDIIIHYTGGMDVLDKVEGFPFIHSYQSLLVKRMSEKVHSEYSGNRMDGRKENFTLGVAYGRSDWEQLIDNIIMMNNVCKGFDIRYQAFLAPGLSLKRGSFSVYEQELIINTDITEESMKETIEFYNNVKKNGEKYLEDITFLFDNEDKVYLDRFHVNERGNALVAEYMYRYLLKNCLI